ncbi:MAG: ion transporter [Gammaproteobacteria bacterium WSBS_2016_MAG_OTU1]
MTANTNKKENILQKPFFEWLISGLIIYSVICFSIETLPDLSPETIRFLHYSEIATVAIFTVEYFYRIYVAPNRIKFIFSFYGLIDLIAILPFYLTFAVDLQSMRFIRLLRLISILKLSIYNKAVNRFNKAIYLVKEELIIFTLASMIVFYLAAVGIYHFEHDAQPDKFRSIFDCVWWAVITLTTVGYGDIYPITIGGRLFTFLILILGLGLVAVPAGLVASSFSVVRHQEKEEEISNKPNEMP